MKRCHKCSTELDVSCFAKNRAKKDGLQDRCRNCDREYNAKRRESHKKWRAKPINAAKVRKRTALWREENPERNKASVEHWMKQNSAKRREYIAKYNRERRATDLNFKLRVLLRGRICSCVRLQKKGRKSFKKAGSAVSDLGCSIEELISYLGAKFAPGMTWASHGTLWEVDHIRPLANFDLTDREQFLVACHYKNLQPLWIDEHLEKTKQEATSRCKSSVGQ